MSNPPPPRYKIVERDGRLIALSAAAEVRLGRVLLVAALSGIVVAVAAMVDPT